MSVVAIVQARMGSSRLPGKVLLDLAGKPMLARVVARLSRAQMLDTIAVATSTHAHDDVLAEWCRAARVPCVRGSENDVLDRYYKAAQELGATTVVRVTSDCPFIEPSIVDRVVRALHADESSAYASNINPERFYPRGLDVEAFRLSALKEAQDEATLPPHREHVTPFMWEQPQRFPQVLVKAEVDLSHLRWTVDTPEDYEFARRAFAHFGTDTFDLDDMVDLVRSDSELAALNAHISQKPL